MSPIKMPSRAELCACLRSTFDLLPIDRAEEVQVNAELVDVYEGCAMNSGFLSYSAQFALPAGVNLPRSLFAVRESRDGGDVGQAWLLLLTPVLPGEDGRERMEAVFHVPSQVVAAAVTPMVLEARGHTGSLVI